MHVLYVGVMPPHPPTPSQLDPATAGTAPSIHIACMRCESDDRLRAISVADPVPAESVSLRFIIFLFFDCCFVLILALAFPLIKNSIGFQNASTVATRPRPARTPKLGTARHGSRRQRHLQCRKAAISERHPARRGAAVQSAASFGTPCAFPRAARLALAAQVGSLDGGWMKRMGRGSAAARPPK